MNKAQKGHLKPSTAILWNLQNNALNILFILSCLPGLGFSHLKSLPTNKSVARADPGENSITNPYNLGQQQVQVTASI